VTDQAGSTVAQRRYQPYGAPRWSHGTSPTNRTYTGQRSEDFGLLDYNARYYDPHLHRFLSPDSIVPSVGEGNNPNAVGYVANANYSALVIDYHENQFIEQLNQENRIRLEDPRARFPSVPTNPLAFDRYAYCFNNPVRYNDPNGHNPALALAFLGGVGFTISAPVLIIGGLVVVAAVVAYDTFAPGKEQRHAEISAGLTSLTNQATQAANGVHALFAKKPDVALADRLQGKYGLTDAERRRLHDWLTGQGLSDAEWEEAFRDFAREKKQRQEEKQKLREENQE
jgi:RHS repeat-associated protein